jgi:hypothetical protein
LALFCSLQGADRLAFSRVPAQRKAGSAIRRRMPAKRIRPHRREPARPQVVLATSTAVKIIRTGRRTQILIQGINGLRVFVAKCKMMRHKMSRRVRTVLRPCARIAREFSKYVFVVCGVRTISECGRGLAQRLR